jgi:DNA-binding transcriptional MerR regulator
MSTYSVKKLANLSGVSVRTLHLYDKLGLLKPLIRTEARYRLYGERELLRLQQILFYKELDFSLQEICGILDEPDFDLVQALKSHQSALKARRDRLSTLLVTIDKTILKLKGKNMISDEELYEGLSKEKAVAYRNEAIEKYGEDTVKKSENYLKKLTKEEFAKLGMESEDIRKKLFSLMQDGPTNAKVQEQIARHYQSIRAYWGTAGSADSQAEAYRGLGQLYVSDERFTLINNKPNPEFALFMSEAMSYFADKKLK